VFNTIHDGPHAKHWSDGGRYWNYLLTFAPYYVPSPTHNRYVKCYHPVPTAKIGSAVFVNVESTPTPSTVNRYLQATQEIKSYFFTGYLVDKLGNYKPVVIISLFLNLVFHHSLLFIPHQEMPGVMPAAYVVRHPDTGIVEV